MTKTTQYYSKRITWSFFIGVFFCGIILYAVYYLTEVRTSTHSLQSDFIEVFPSLVEDVTQTALLSTNPTTVVNTTIEEPPKSQYIEVTESCGAHYDDNDCLNVRQGPGADFPIVSKLRNGIVLKVDDLISNDEGDWYKIVFDEWLRYPDRVSANWYVSAKYVKSFTHTGIEDISTYETAPSSNKRIVIDRTKQTLSTYDGETFQSEIVISTGLDLSPTPRGVFTIFRKTPTRYMQGPLPGIPGSDYYDLPGVPWNLYFTQQGAVIHGAYWHDSFGSQYSHGCVNLPPNLAEELYHWADIGTEVVVRD